MFHQIILLPGTSAVEHIKKIYLVQQEYLKTCKNFQMNNIILKIIRKRRETPRSAENTLKQHKLAGKKRNAKSEKI